MMPSQGKPGTTGQPHRARPGGQRSIPFSFVLDYLHSREPVVRQMFGCHSIYVGGKIVLILREKETHPDDNGVWIATTREHHESLRHDFPSMRSINLLGKEVTGWQNLPSTSPDFESSVIKACELVVRGDPRIGKIPPPKKTRRRKTKKKNR